MTTPTTEHSWWEVMSDVEAETYHPARHWEPFGTDEIDRVLMDLPTMISEAALAPTILLNQRIAAKLRPLPAGEPEVALLAWPSGPVSTLVSIRLSPQENSLEGIYPFLQGGPNVPVTLERAVLMPDRCHAILHGTLSDGTEVGFFDLHWGATRTIYRRRESPEFVLGLLAYRLRIIEGPEPIPTPAWIAQLRTDTPGSLPSPWREGATIDMGGMDAWLMRPDLAPDEMELQGTVESVERLPHVLRGQSISKLRVVAGDARLAVFLTDHVAQGRVPKVGERVSLFGWLSGALWWVD